VLAVPNSVTLLAERDAGVLQEAVVNVRTITARGITNKGLVSAQICIFYFHKMGVDNYNV
jgi:hypothetical protein